MVRVTVRARRHARAGIRGTASTRRRLYSCAGSPNTCGGAPSSTTSPSRSTVVRGVDPKLIEATTVSGFTRAERLRHVVLPGAMPSTLTGLRLALGIAWLSIIVAETTSADAGLGYMIMNARELLRTDVIVVGLAVYALLGLGTDALVRRLERTVLAWRPAGPAGADR